MNRRSRIEIAVTQDASRRGDFTLLGITLESENITNGRQFGFAFDGRNDNLGDLDLIGVVDSLFLQGIKYLELSPTGIAQMNEPACGLPANRTVDLRGV